MRQWQSELLRLQAELALDGSTEGLQEAESWLRDSLAIAREQKGRSLELRPAVSLARLLAQQGKTREAHELLAPTFDFFTEGLETPDLKHARALLASLSRS